MKIHINARAGLGDTVYFFSIIQTLLKYIKTVDISAICWNTAQELYSSQLPLRQIINANDLVNVMGKGWSHTSARAKKIFADKIGKVDYYIDLQAKQSYLNETLSVEANTRIAVNPETSMTDYYDVVIRTMPDEHILETYRRMLSEVFGIAQYIEPGRFVEIPELGSKVDRITELLLKKERRPVVCIHPGAKGLEKLWNVLHWGQVVNWLINERNFQPVILGSSLRFAGMSPILDIPSAQAIQLLSYDKALDMAGKTESVLFLIELIRRAQLYIGLDTGPTHIAAVCGVPTLELFKRESPAQYSAWRARGDKVVTIVEDSMDLITPERVIAQLQDWQALKDVSIRRQVTNTRG
ncbi:MAG: glycosyltransferase family 9 protein [Candidatus Auribacterota bacterium]|jgi:ADP-heptose:LPS heptosyltransferase|nr:glycosyltransferase family 9 protein [Candidatus Auribacterota bacterium]